MAPIAKPKSVTATATGRLVDQFLPSADVSERHETLVHAPAHIVFDVAQRFDLQSIPLVRGIFWLRAKLLGAAKPPADRFATFAGPDLVKIVWTLEAEPVEPALTRFRTETRVQATDESARRSFRRYWRRFGMGIVLIRWLLLPAVRREAERRYRAGGTWLPERSAWRRERGWGAGGPNFRGTMKTKELIDSAVQHLHTRASMKNVYGEPIVFDGKTVIPVAKVESGTTETGGGPARPIGVVEITGQETKFVSFGQTKKLSIVAMIGSGLGFVLGLLLRRRTKH